AAVSAEGDAKVGREGGGDRERAELVVVLVVVVAFLVRIAQPCGVNDSSRGVPLPAARGHVAVVLGDVAVRRLPDAAEGGGALHLVGALAGQGEGRHEDAYQEGDDPDDDDQLDQREGVIAKATQGGRIHGLASGWRMTSISLKNV